MTGTTWRASLYRDGYAHFSGLCPEPLIRAAREAIDADRYAVYFRLWLNDIDERRWHFDDAYLGGWHRDA